MKLQRSLVNIINFKKYKILYFIILALISGYFSYNYLFKSESFTQEEQTKINNIKLSATKLAGKMGSALSTSPIAPLIIQSVKHVMEESQNELQAFVKDIMELGPAIIPVLIETIGKPVIKIVMDVLDLLKKDLIKDIKNNDTALAQAIEEKINGLSKSDLKNMVDLVVDSAADVDINEVINEVKDDNSYDVNSLNNMNNVNTLTSNQKRDKALWNKKWMNKY